MEIRKAVITAAGPSQRTLPLQTLVDRDGKTKTALAIIIEEALNSGIEEICVVVHPGDAEAYRAAAGPHGKRLQFVEQDERAGLRPRRLVRARFHRRATVSAAGGRSSLSEPREPELRAATRRSGRGGILRRFRRAGHARKQTAILRRGRRTAGGKSQGALSRFRGAGKTHAHRSRTKA